MKNDARSQIIEKTAKICHQANKAYCETIGDGSHVDWEKAPEWQKESVRKGVVLHLDGEHGPEASHESWMKEKIANGWTYGEIKDENAKTHPCIKPFAELPPLQQNKDILFLNIVHAFKGKIAK